MNRTIEELKLYEKYLIGPDPDGLNRTIEELKRDSEDGEGMFIGIV